MNTLKNIGYFLLSLGVIVFGLIAFSTPSSADIPVSNVRVWEVQTELNDQNLSLFPALNSAKLSTTQKKSLLSQCLNQTHTNARRPVGALEFERDVVGHCEGVIGETACIRESLRQATDACIARNL
jgi:hypothetical protein